MDFDFGLTARPLRYRLRRFLHIFSEIKWWVLWRTTERYNSVPTGLKFGYYDCDTRMEESMFYLLKEFVDVEYGGIESVRSAIAWADECKNDENAFFTPEQAEEYKNLWQSVESIYLWCTVDRPKMQAERDRYADGWYNLEEQITNKDTEMLKLLVEIRGALWT